MPSERLEAEILTLAERLSAGTYELLVLVGEFDARGTWATWGYLSCAAWLAHVCDIESSTARTQIRVAHALRTFPDLDACDARRRRLLRQSPRHGPSPHPHQRGRTRPPRHRHARRRSERGDRPVVPTPRRPRRDRTPPTRRTVRHLADRPRRDGHHHRPPRARRRSHHLRCHRRTRDPHPRASGRVAHPAARRRPRRHRHHPEAAPSTPRSSSTCEKTASPSPTAPHSPPTPSPHSCPTRSSAC